MLVKLSQLRMVLCGLALLCLVACGDGAVDNVAAADERLTGVATLTVTGLPEGARVVTLSWFLGKDDDHFQGVIYPYSDGMEIPAGKLMFLIEGKGYESLLARRIPVYGDTVLEAQMCKLGEGCYGTLTDSRSMD